MYHSLWWSERLPLFTQQDLTAMVGSSRVFVNRSLRIMEENRAIRLERRHIVITGEQALKKMIRLSSATGGVELNAVLRDELTKNP